MNEPIRLIEVAARDGLQNEAKTLSVADRISFIQQLADAGLYWIEAGSFVHPKAVPQMKGSDEVAAYFKTNPIRADLSYLVPNMRGLESALAQDVKHIAVFLAATESFSQANLRKSIEESFEMIQPVMKEALANDIKVRGYLSTVFKSVDGEPTSPEYVAHLSERLLEMGCYEISLGDTTGVGTPEATEELIAAHVKLGISLNEVALHYHDTFGHAIDNIDCAYDLGIRSFDASTSGIGGCPFAKSATGNVDMLKLIAWANRRSLDISNIDSDKLQKTANWINQVLSKH